MHGTLVNFDNEVVATKAWNRLFAVADWADARRRQAKPVEPTPTLRESLNRWQEVQNQKARIEEWQPHEYEPDLTAGDPPELARVCADFLARWQKQQWAPVGAHFMELGSTRSSVGKLAVEAKDLYRTHELSSWMILRVRHVAAAVAHTDVEIVVNGATYRTDLRWVRIDDAGSTATEWEPGRWALSMYGPSHFLRREAIIEQPESHGSPTTGTEPSSPGQDHDNEMA